MTRLEPPTPPSTDGRLVLATAALHLLGDGATPDEISERFTAAGATLGDGLADDLIDELLGLGLARVARKVGDVRHVVPTSLGTTVRSGSLAGDVAARLADLEALRTDLLSTIAHELRTPLTAVRTSAGLLADPGTAPTEEQRRTLLAAIERNADRMQRLVGDILELARFRSGSIRLQLRRFEACELARAVAASVEPLARARGQEILVRGCNESVSVFGDHRRLEQALLNLVSNAQRFSPDRATIDVTVELVEDRVRWTVRDAGPGIPDNDRARLFERFFVGRNDRHAVGEGVGLGLPTALAIAQAHGGTIDVDSHVGRGSTFALVVPIDGPGEHD